MTDNLDDILAPTPIKEPIQDTDPSASRKAATSSAGETPQKGDASTRYIPEHKKHDAALTFPEKVGWKESVSQYGSTLINIAEIPPNLNRCCLFFWFISSQLMAMMQFADKQDHESFCIAWLPDGLSFVIRNPDEFTRTVVIKFFKATKFSSFTRKLYRWGFRQVNRGIGPEDPIIFGNDHFQRDNLELMTHMRSITAATIRKQEEDNLQWSNQKRALESIESEQNAKRMFLMNQLMKQTSSYNTGMLPSSGNINLSQAMMGNMSRMGNMGNMNVGNNGFGLMNQFSGQNPFLSSFPQSTFNNFNGNQDSQCLNNLSSTADIVNAAINALRFAP